MIKEILLVGITGFGQNNSYLLTTKENLDVVLSQLEKAGLSYTISPEEIGSLEEVTQGLNSYKNLHLEAILEEYKLEVPLPQEKSLKENKKNLYKSPLSKKPLFYRKTKP